MPFLEKIQRWAEQRPHDTAVVIAGIRLDWAALRDAAAGLVAEQKSVTTLRESNSVDFAVKFAAAVAGNRQCAVLDPSWPVHLQEEIARQVEACAVPAPVSPDDRLADGAPESSFLIGLTSGTTSVPKAFTRSRRSWQQSFDASIEFFGLRQDDVTLAPGPLAASLNLYALAECLYAGSEFQTLETFDVGDVHAAITHDRVTRLVLVPTMLRMLSERGLMGCVDASGIRTIICAGSKLDARTLEAARRWAPNATIYEYYGASELSFVSGLGLAPGQAEAAGGTGIGRPFPGVDVRILDDGGR
ncbi:MAG TPA: AMP-binding protein, partial [Arthrobacter sp.]|nr:AMP-binding protein [Arthrobacter sp.]